MAGRIEVICGCMFSGKSEELLRRLRRVHIAKQGVLLIKPRVDDRYSDSEVVSHSAFRMEAIPVPGEDPWEIVKLWLGQGEPPVVGIDEGQFFEDLTPVVQRLVRGGSRVIIAGLDLDYRGEPFLAPELLSLAERVDKLTAVCVVCGGPATRTHRLSGGTERVEIGASDRYDARCREHWDE